MLMAESSTSCRWYNHLLKGVSSYRLRREELDRQNHIARFYQLLDRLENAVGGANRLKDCSGYMPWPNRGVYFFFEDGERRSESDSGIRVVRIGTHALTEGSRSTLWQRLRGHRGTDATGGGNHRGSIFRLLVGTALAKQNPELRVATWDNGKSSDSAVRPGEHAMEAKVSEVIRNMPFLCLEIDDAPGPNSLRGYIERNSIALLSNYSRRTVDAPSSNWLGSSCARGLVRESGLWNQENVRAGYDPVFLDQLEQLIHLME